MESAYTEAYRQLYEEHWWWRAREALILRTLRRLIRTRPCRILDVGCGDGLLFDRLLEFGEVEGLEIDPAAVSNDGKHRHRIHVGSLNGNFQPANSFDVILMLDVLEHMLEPAKSLMRVAELIDPQGTIVITVPAFPQLWTRHDEMNHHYTRYTKGSLKRLLQDAGLTAMEQWYFFHWLYPMKRLTRLKETVLSGGLRPPRVPPAILNRLLYAFSRCEQEIFGPLRLPFGSSLFTLAGRHGETRFDNSAPTENFEAW